MLTIRSSSHSSRFALVALAGACIGLVLAACEEPPAERERDETRVETTQTRAVPATGATQQAGLVEHLALLPDADSRGSGVIMAAIRGGGFDAFNDFGERVLETSGPALTSLAAVPAFDLRGTRLALMFGSDADRALRGFLVLPGVTAVEELPLDTDGITDPLEGVCLYRQGTGFVELALLHAGRQASLWRMTDGGGERLSLTHSGDIALPFTAERCAAADGDLVIASTTGGLARVNTDGQVRADRDGISVENFAFVELYGRPVVLVSFAEQGVLGTFDARDFSEIANIEVREELSIPGLRQPGAIVVSDAPFSGMGFSNGLAAVYDRGDNRIKLVTRDVLARAVTSGE